MAKAAGRVYVPRAERLAQWAAARAAKQPRQPKPPKPWNAPGLTAVQRRNVRRQHDHEFDVRCRLREQLRRADPRMQARKVGDRLRNAVSARRPSRALERRLGYTVAQLVAHIEALFTPGMTWAAFNAGEIHLDHRTPLVKFDCTTEAGIRAAWAITNLQPLWAADNQRKYTAVLPPLPAVLGAFPVATRLALHGPAYQVQQG